MRVVHWTLGNGSGLDNVAKDLAAGECLLGLDSQILSSADQNQWELGVGADIHVSHSHVPDICRDKGKIVWVGHGTPENCFHTSLEESLHAAHSFGDSWMLVQYWLQHADAMVTFWPRHQKIWQSLCDKGREVRCFPLGVNREFWRPQTSLGKWDGSPSLFTAENCHQIKWPWDIFLMWPWVTEEVPAARLHCFYLPRDQHRFWFPLVYRNGSAFKSHISPNVLSHDLLKNAFSSVDYVLNLVRYGDYNRLGLEAKACGAKVISFKGNPYADFWLDEGNQVTQAEQLKAILKGEVEPRKAELPLGIQETAQMMKELYESL